METSQVSIDKWMNKEGLVFICNGILLGTKKEWDLAIYNNMNWSRWYNAKTDTI